MEATRAMIPIVLFISASTTLFGIFYLRNKENMALIERGINPREGYRKIASLAYLKYAFLMIGGGLGLLSALLIDNAYPNRHLLPDGTNVQEDNPGLYFALIAIGGGLGLLISYFIENRELQKRSKQE